MLRRKCFVGSMQEVEEMEHTAASFSFKISPTDGLVGGGIHDLGDEGCSDIMVPHTAIDPRMERSIK